MPKLDVAKLEMEVARPLGQGERGTKFCLVAANLL